MSPFAPRFNSPFHSPKTCSSRRAFSLIEMLTVMAVMGILVAVSIGSFAGNSQARLLANGGNLVVDLANQARQNSIAKNVLTALVLVQNSANSNWNGRLFILAQMASGDTSWTPICKWQLLPTGIAVDSSQSATFLTSPTLPYGISGLNYLGTSLPASALAYQVFMPDGRLLTNNTTTSSVVLYIDKGGTSQNYYEITINPYTGTSIVDRP